MSRHRLAAIQIDRADGAIAIGVLHDLSIKLPSELGIKPLIADDTAPASVWESRTLIVIGNAFQPFGSRSVCAIIATDGF